METTSAASCPMHDNVDRRKSADIARRHTKPDDGAHWVRNPGVARRILRSKNARQAGASADFVKFDNPEQAPVFFLDGADHFNKRRKTQRFLSPQAISDQHFVIMRKVTEDLISELRKKGHARLEDLSFTLAIEVVGEILGLTNSDRNHRARRIQNVLYASIMNAGDSAAARLWLNLKRAFYLGIFFVADVRPAIKARKTAPKSDAISFYIEEGYSNMAIVIECLTYGTAGMLTTREFIIMVAWYLFEDAALRERFLASDMKGQLAILMEILRLEPVAAMIHRRVNEAVEGVEANPLPPGEKYGIDIRAANVDEEMVGECPFAVDPDRAARQKDSGRYLSFSDGPHSCPGWQVALQETRIFLEQLFRVPGLRLDRNPDISWNSQLGSYELRNADISCSRSG
jgi:cytochrome P450